MMKNIFLFAVATGLLMTGCNKVIDVYPISNLYDQSFYRNVDEVDNALTGCYNGLQKPLYHEWKMTELRSDNAVMGNPTSGSSDNRELSDLDMFMPATSHSGIYDYWLASYYNIYNVNKVLYNLSVNYDKNLATLSYDSIHIPVTMNDRKRISAEASFIRAYHYFNLVRLFGDVFLIHKPVTPAEAKLINRSPKEDVYNLIIADLKNCIDNGNTTPYPSINPVFLGRANSWAAKAMLAKVYLTLNRKAEAVILLQDVMANSGYALQPTYSGVFSTNNEMNSEILFAVRYKSGKTGLGSPFSNLFAPINSGNFIVNGDGHGYDYPSVELNTFYNASDSRKAFNIKSYYSKIYVAKYISNLVYEDDGENDWPVLRYADVLLMMAEAQGYSPYSISLINQVRNRAGLPVLAYSASNSVASFENSLAAERRFEFAFENQRWFDLIRFNTTLTTITAEQVMKTHFAYMYSRHYGDYPPPALTLQQLQDRVTANYLLLPIPQREIDNNTQIVIPQNPGY